MNRVGHHVRDARNVLMVNGAQTGGGAGRVGELLAQAHRRAGVETRAFVRGTIGDDARTMRAGHWREAALAHRMAGLGFAEIAHLSSFLWRCRDAYASADLLHLHNLHGEFLSIAALPLWGFDKPIVWTLHDFWALTGNCATPRSCDRWRRGCGRCPLRGVYPMTRVDRSYFYRMIKPRLIAAAGPILVTPSRWLAECVAEVPLLRGLPTRVIRNPIDTADFSPCDAPQAVREQFGLRRDGATIVMAGSNWGEAFKGAAHAIEALRQAASHLPGVQLLIVGRDGRRVLRESGVGGRELPYAGDRGTLARAYGCADVCLFPSLAENYPLTTLEAMACGTPVVAYSLGGIPEQIEHGRTGMLACENDVGELAAGLTSLLRDAPRAKRMGAAARAFVLKTNNVEHIAGEYRRCYREAIGLWYRRRSRRDPRLARGRMAHWIARRMGWETAPPRAQPSQAVPYRPLPVLGGVG